jgi:hypothetical protein
MVKNKNKKGKYNMHETLKTEHRYSLISVPLLLRLFEFIHEEKNLTDEDLHLMAERIGELTMDGVRMNMNQYKNIVPEIKAEQPEPEPFIVSKTITSTQTFEATSK